jgi:hypothetical protein
MPEIPKYEQWKSETSKMFHRRGQFLTALDQAIELGDRERIATAFDNWKRDKTQRGKKWWDSVFNEEGAITRLYRALNNDRILLTREEIEALAWLRQQQGLALSAQFKANQVTWKPGNLMALATNAGSFKQKLLADKVATVKSVAGDASTVHSIHGFITELCKGTSGAETNIAKVKPEDVLHALKLGDLSGFTNSLAPFLGSISSGATAVQKWVSVARKAWQGLSLLEQRGRTIVHGDPDAAFRAMMTLVTREIENEKTSAEIASAAFTAKSLGLLVDGGAVSGPAAGLAETLANLFHTIFQYVRIEEERIKANELINRGTLDFHLFETCPLLGCYYLLVQDHSTIIALSMSSYGQHGWMMEAELLRRELEGVLAKSRDLAASSPIEIANFRNHKGFVESRSLTTKLSSAASDYVSDSWSNTKAKLWFYMYGANKEKAKDEIEMTSSSPARNLYTQKLQVMKAVSTYKRETGFFSRQSKESLSAVQHIDALCAHGQTDENIQQIDELLSYLFKGGPKPAGYGAEPLNRESRLAKLLEKAMV